MAIGCLLHANVGCSPYQLAHRTLQAELAEYPRVTDGRQANEQYLRWAKSEWKQLEQDGSGESYSNDYASGFIQGFVDHVYAGGNTEAPPVPPRKYWRTGYRNERGRQAVQNWYDGFAHGARVAREKGYRDRAVVPSSVYTLDEPTPLDLRAKGAPQGNVSNSTPGSLTAPQIDDSERGTPTLADPSESLPLPTDSDGPESPRESASEVTPPAASDESDADGNVGNPGFPGNSPGFDFPDGEAPMNFPIEPFESESLPPSGDPVDLPRETANDLPPPPPWRQQPGPTALVSTNEGEFDPFAGTKFAQVAQALAVRDDKRPTAPTRTTAEAPPILPTNVPKAATKAAPYADNGESTDWVTPNGFTLELPPATAGPASSNSPAATIQPLSFWTSEASDPTVLQQPLIQAGGVSTSAQSAQEPPFIGELRLNLPANAIPSEVPAALGASDSRRADGKDRDRQEPSASANHDGWQAIPTSDDAQWKAKNE